jgi:hypothetical protein
MKRFTRRSLNAEIRGQIKRGARVSRIRNLLLPFPAENAETAAREVIGVSSRVPREADAAGRRPDADLAFEDRHVRPQENHDSQ